MTDHRAEDATHRHSVNVTEEDGFVRCHCSCGWFVNHLTPTVEEHDSWCNYTVMGHPGETCEQRRRPPVESKVVDLMAALEQSVQDAREARSRHGR